MSFDVDGIFLYILMLLYKNNLVTNYNKWFL